MGWGLWGRGGGWVVLKIILYGVLICVCLVMVVWVCVYVYVRMRVCGVFLCIGMMGKGGAYIILLLLYFFLWGHGDVISFC